jgi:hypothetical protein
MSTDLIGSGEAYTTKQAWWDDIPAIVSEAERGEVTNTAEIVTSVATLFDGLTLGGNTVTLTAASGDSFADHASKASNPLRYNETVGAAWSNSGNNTMLEINNDITISKLMWEKVNDYQRMVLLTSSGNAVTFSQMIFDGSCGNEHMLDSRNATYENCLFIDRGSDTAHATIISSGASVANNCTFIGIGSPTTRYGALQYPGSLVMTNCAFFGYATPFYDGTPTGSNNASDQATMFGTSNQASKTFANQFESTTTDFRLKSGADCINNGTSSGMPLTDIVGQSRSGNYDIGAWEFQAGGGGGSSIPNIVRHLRRQRMK